jgi:hypothetical protein
MSGSRLKAFPVWALGRGYPQQRQLTCELNKDWALYDRAA